jgi:predicted 2-oxoglutarate/Fe(II)-dependent dioxygenase YbiX
VDAEAVLGRAGLSDRARLALESGDPATVYGELVASLAHTRGWEAVRTDPGGLRLWALPNLLSAKECASLRGEMDDAPPLKRAMATGEPTAHTPPLWRGHLAELPPDLVRDVALRVGTLLSPIAAAFGTPLSAVEEPRFVIYRRNDFCGSHRDNPGEPRVGEPIARRRITVVLFLNSGKRLAGKSDGSNDEPTFSGGVLNVYGSGAEANGQTPWPVSGQQGSLVAIRADQPYELTRVTAGRAYVVTAWLLSP